MFDEPLVLLGEDGVQFFDPYKPKAYCIAGPSWVNNHAHVLRTRHPIDRRFLLHYLNNFDFHGYANGTTRLKLTQAAIKRIPVVHPDLDEQRRIVNILEDHLSRLDAAESGLALTRARLSSLMERVVISALVGGTVQGERANANLQPAGTVDGDLADLPSGWTWRRLGELAEVVGGVTKDSKRQADPAYVEVPYLRVANVQRGYLDLENVVTIRVPPAKSEALRLLPGDVLMNEGGDRDKLARGWVWEGQIENCIHQNHVFRARVSDNSIDPRLLSWAANTIGAKWAERNGRQSVNLASISLSAIRRMPVPVPPIKLQPKIVAQITQTLEATRRLDASVDNRLRQSGGLRRALLAAAFSGRLTGRSNYFDEVEESTEVAAS